MQPNEQHQDIRFLFERYQNSKFLNSEATEWLDVILYHILCERLASPATHSSQNQSVAPDVIDCLLLQFQQDIQSLCSNIPLPRRRSHHTTNISDHYLPNPAVRTTSTRPRASSIPTASTANTAAALSTAANVSVAIEAAVSSVAPSVTSDNSSPAISSLPTGYSGIPANSSPVISSVPTGYSVAPVSSDSTVSSLPDRDPVEADSSASSARERTELSLLVEYLVAGRGLLVLTALCHLQHSISCLTSEMCTLLCSLVDPLLQSLPTSSAPSAGDNNNNNRMGSCCCDWCFTSLPATWQQATSHGRPNHTDLHGGVSDSEARRHTTRSHQTKEETGKSGVYRTSSDVTSLRHDRHYCPHHRRRFTAEVSSDENDDCKQRKYPAAASRSIASSLMLPPSTRPITCRSVCGAAMAVDSTEDPPHLCQQTASEYMRSYQRHLLRTCSRVEAAGCCVSCVSVGRGLSSLGSGISHVTRLIVLILCRHQLHTSDQHLNGAVLQAVSTLLYSHGLAALSCKHHLELLLFTLTVCSVSDASTRSLSQQHHAVCGASVKRLVEFLSSGVWCEQHEMSASVVIAVCRYCTCLLALCGRPVSCHSRYAQNTAIVYESLKKVGVRQRVEAYFSCPSVPRAKVRRDVIVNYNCNLTSDCMSGLITVLAELCQFSPTCSDVALRSSRLTLLGDSDSSLMSNTTHCRLAASTSLTPCLAMYSTSMLVNITTKLVKKVLQSMNTVLLSVSSAKSAVLAQPSVNLSLACLLQLCRTSIQRLRLCCTCWCPSTSLSSLFHCLSQLLAASVQNPGPIVNSTTDKCNIHCGRYWKRPGALLELAGRVVVALISWLLNSVIDWRQCSTEHHQQWLTVCAHLLTASNSTHSPPSSFVRRRLRRCLRTRLLADVRRMPPETVSLLMRYVFLAPPQCPEEADSVTVTPETTLPEDDFLDRRRQRRARCGSLVLSACCALIERLLLARSCPAEDIDLTCSRQLQLLQLLQPLQLLQLLEVECLCGRVQRLFCRIADVSLLYRHQISDTLADECVAVLLSVGLDQLSAYINSHRMSSESFGLREDSTNLHRRDSSPMDRLIVGHDSATPHRERCFTGSSPGGVAVDLHCVDNIWLTCRSILAVSRPLCSTSLLLQPNLHPHLLSISRKLLLFMHALDSIWLGDSVDLDKKQRVCGDQAQLLCTITASVIGVCLSLERHCRDDLLASDSGVSTETALAGVLAEVTPVSPPLQRHLPAALLTTSLVDVGSECSLHNRHVLYHHIGRDSVSAPEHEMGSNDANEELDSFSDDIDEDSDVSSGITAYIPGEHGCCLNEVGGACTNGGGVCLCVGGVNTEMGGANPIELSFDRVSGYEADGEGSVIANKRRLKDVWRVGNKWILHSVSDMVTRGFLQHCDSYMRQKCVDAWQNYLRKCGALDSDNVSLGNSTDEVVFSVAKKRRAHTIGSLPLKEGEVSVSVPAEDICSTSHERLYPRDEYHCQTKTTSFSAPCLQMVSPLPAVFLNVTASSSSEQISSPTGDSRISSLYNSLPTTTSSSHPCVTPIPAPAPLPLPSVSLPASATAMMTSTVSSDLKCMSSSLSVDTSTVTPPSTSPFSSESWVVTDGVAAVSSCLTDQYDVQCRAGEEEDRQAVGTTLVHDDNIHVSFDTDQYDDAGVGNVTLKKTTSIALSEIQLSLPVATQFEMSRTSTTESVVSAAEIAEISAAVIAETSAARIAVTAIELAETSAAEIAETAAAGIAETSAAETAVAAAAEITETSAIATSKVLNSAEESTKPDDNTSGRSAKELRLTYFSQLEHVCQLLLTLCRQSDINTALILHSNIVRTLVCRLEPLFQVNEPDAEDAVRSCLQLFLYVHRNDFSGDILRLYSGFFTSSNPPVTVLVDSLFELIRDSDPSTASCFQFGCEPSAAVSAFSSAQTDVAAFASTAGTGLASKWQEVHLGRRLDSCFAHSAASVFLNTAERPFDPFAGFSLSVWLRLRPGQTASGGSGSGSAAMNRGSVTGMAANNHDETQTRAHVFSLVSDGRALELWLQNGADGLLPGSRGPSGASILLRRCELGASTLSVLATAAVNSISLPIGDCWQHLAVRVVSNGTFSTVSVFLNGVFAEDLDLPTAGGSVPPAAEVQLLFGDRQLVSSSSSCSCFSLQLASLSVFGEPVVDLDSALVLTLLGFNCGALSSHRRRKFDACLLSPYVSRVEFTSANLVRVVSSFSEILTKLENALLLTLCSERPRWACLYKSPLEGVSVAVPVLWQTGALCITRRANVLATVSQLGGVHFLLYLLARVIELRVDAVTQARALSALLTALPAVESLGSCCCDSSSLLADVLALVFSSDHCHVSPWLLQAYLSGCISGVSVFVRDPAVVVSIACSNPAIVNFQLVRGFFTHWPVWLSYNDGELFSLAVSTVTACLDGRHKLSGYNKHIVHEHNLLQTVLDFLLSFFVDNSGATLSWAVTEQVLSLLTQLLDRPSGGSAIGAIWRSILLLHPDSHMFVRVNRSSCFYLLEPAVRQHGDSLLKPQTATTTTPTTPETVTTAESSETELPHSGTQAPSIGDSVTAASAATALSAVSPSKQQLVSRFLQSLPDARPRCPSVIQPPPELFEVQLLYTQQRLAAATSYDLSADDRTDGSDTGLESGPVSFSGAYQCDSARSYQILADLMVTEANKLMSGWRPKKPVRVDCHHMIARLIDVLTVHAASVCVRERAPLLRSIRPEHLCSLVSHPVSAVRCSVIQLTSLYLKNVTEKSDRSVSSSFFHLLANQLHRLPVDLPLAASCCSLVSSHLTAVAGLGPVSTGLDPVSTGLAQGSARDETSVFAVLLALLAAPLSGPSTGIQRQESDSTRFVQHQGSDPAHHRGSDSVGVARGDSYSFTSLRVVGVLNNVIDKCGWVVPGLLDMGAVEALLSTYLFSARARVSLAARAMSGVDVCDAHCAAIAKIIVAIARHLLLATSTALFRALSDILVLINYMYTAERKYSSSSASIISSPSSPSSTSVASVLIHLHLTVINSCVVTLKNTLNLPWTRYLSCWPSQKQLRDRNRRLLLWSTDVISLLEPRGLCSSSLDSVRRLLDHVAEVSDICRQSGASSRGHRVGITSMLDSMCLSLLSPDWCIEIRLQMADILCSLSRSQLESLLVSANLNSARRRQQLICFIGDLLRYSDSHVRPTGSAMIGVDVSPVRFQVSVDRRHVSSPYLPAVGSAVEVETFDCTAHGSNPSLHSFTGRFGLLSESGRSGRMMTSPDRVSTDLTANLRRLVELVWRQTLRSRQKCSRDEDNLNISFYTRQFRGDRCAQLVQWQNKVVKLEKRALHCFDTHYSRMCSVAVQYTAVCTQEQNRARLDHIQMLRNGLLREAEARSLWKVICSEMTECAAPFEHPRSRHWFARLGNSQGWLQQCRILKRTQLMLDRRFFKAEARQRLESELIPTPLSYLFSADSGSNLGADYIKQMHSASVKYTVTCDIIVLDCSVSGEVLLSDSSIFFVVDKLTAIAEDLALADIESGYLQWSCADVYEVRRRRYELRDCAAEIFLQSGRSHLLVFSATQVRDRFMMELLGNTSVQLHDAQLLSECTVRWREGTLSNFEYLMFLNKMAGRSFNDLMQYPVFPFVLSDYSSESIDLGSPAVYRDLRRPMGVQNPQREAFYRQRYAYLQSTEAMGVETPYHYSSLYSNSAVVMHFLLRVPPFTNFFLRFQDGNFDLADRTFHSVPHAWRLSTSSTGTDFKELTPEFYYLHEMFYNTQDFRLGYRQSGDCVDCVALPSWSRVSGCDTVRQMACQSRLFVLVLRQALESDTVRRALPHWIDLVFGLKQRGAAAVHAVNVFHPATYGGYDVELCGDMSVLAIQTMVRTYGQIPRLLFRSAHPHMADNFRSPASSKVSLLPCVSGLRWGDCVGSPDVPVASVVWKRPLSAPASSLVLLPASSAVVVLPPSTGLAVHWDRGKDYRTAALPTADQLNWLNWGHIDGVVRLWMDQKVNTIPTPSSGDQLEMCCYACGKVWLAMCSGALLVVDTEGVGHRSHNLAESGHGSHDSARSMSVTRCHLTHHCDCLVSLRAWHEYSVVTSADRCGVVAVWDADSVELLRRIRIGGSVIDLYLSRSMADLFILYAPWSPDTQPRHPHIPLDPTQNKNNNSCLAAVTINGAEVANCFCDRQVTCICVSGVTEGLAVNLVAAGTVSGHVIFYDTWRLQQMDGGLPAPSLPSDQRSVTSLCYSTSARSLLVLHHCSMLVLWSCSGLRPSNRALSVLHLNTLSPSGSSLPDWSYKHYRQMAT